VAYRGEIVRIEKWLNNTKGDYLPEKTVGLLPSMTAEMRYWVAKSVDVERRTKLILAEAGETSLNNPFYLAFAKELMRLRATLQGSQLLLMADAIRAKWALRGLTNDTLERIRNSVFSLAAPPAP
jgi:hypothetical protein